MGSKSKNIPGERDLLEVLVKALSRSSEPKTVLQLREGLTGPYKRPEPDLTKCLADLVTQGKAHEWPACKGKEARFWTEEWLQYAENQLFEVLTRQPLTRVQTAKAVKKRLFGVPKTRLEKHLPALVRSMLKRGRIYEYPLESRKRSKRLGVGPPDATPYLAKMLKEFGNVCQKLAGVGVSEARVAQTASELIGQKAEPVGSRESIGQRIVEMMVNVEPRARTGALVLLGEVRKRLGVSKELFDQSVVELANSGNIYLHRHTFPGGLSQQERDYLVDDHRGGFFVGAVLAKRNP